MKPEDDALLSELDDDPPIGPAGVEAEDQAPLLSELDEVLEYGFGPPVVELDELRMLDEEPLAGPAGVELEATPELEEYGDLLDEDPLTGPAGVELVATVTLDEEEVLLEDGVG